MDLSSFLCIFIFSAPVLSLPQQYGKLVSQKTEGPYLFAPIFQLMPFKPDVLPPTTTTTEAPLPPTLPPIIDSGGNPIPNPGYGYGGPQIWLNMPQFESVPLTYEDIVHQKPVETVPGEGMPLEPVDPDSMGPIDSGTDAPAETTTDIPEYVYRLAPKYDYSGVWDTYMSQVAQDFKDGKLPSIGDYSSSQQRKKRDADVPSAISNDEGLVQTHPDLPFGINAQHFGFGPYGQTLETTTEEPTGPTDPTTTTTPAPPVTVVRKIAWPILYHPGYLHVVTKRTTTTEEPTTAGPTDSPTTEAPSTPKYNSYPVATLEVS